MPLDILQKTERKPINFAQFLTQYRPQTARAKTHGIVIHRRLAATLYLRFASEHRTRRSILPKKNRRAQTPKIGNGSIIGGLIACSVLSADPPVPCTLVKLANHQLQLNLELMVNAPRNIFFYGVHSVTPEMVI